MSRRTQDVLVYSALLAIIGLCLWSQHRAWRKGEDRLAAIEQRLAAAERNWSEFAKELLRLTATTNVVVQQDAIGSRSVRFAAPGAAEPTTPPHEHTHER